MSTVLVLGATGNLGGLTAQALTTAHPDVTLRLTSSKDSGCDTLRERFPQAEVLKADWYDPASLTAALQGVDRVFMATPDFYTDESVATPNVIAAVKAAGSVKQVVRFIAIPPGMTAADLAPEFLATRCGANLHVVAKPLFDASGLPVTYLNAACWIMFNLPWFMAESVKSKRQLTMPAASDASRLWLSENDIAAVAAKVLTDAPEQHVGQDYLLTGTERMNFTQVAQLLSEVLGEPVRYVDDATELRATMGESYDTLMTYFRHETRDYGDVPVTDTVARLLGRPQVTLRDYVQAHRDLFV